MVEKDCKLKKTGTDTWVGDTYSAPCGWATYNRLDISHYEWHRRKLDKHDKRK